jgi:hypothetical protein
MKVRSETTSYAKQVGSLRPKKTYVCMTLCAPIYSHTVQLHQIYNDTLKPIHLRYEVDQGYYHIFPPLSC